MGVFFGILFIVNVWFSQVIMIQSSGNNTDKSRCDKNDLRISEISNDMICLTWYNNGTNKTSFVYDEINNGKLIDSTNGSTYNVSGVQPNKKYSFRVCYENSSSFWECTCGSINITSKGEEDIYNIEITSLTSVSFILQWKSTRPANSSFKILVKEVDTPNLTEMNFTTTNRSLFVGDLEEFITYEISLQIVNNDTSQHKIYRKSVTTNSAVPSGYPENFTATPVSPTSMNLSWNPPSFYDRNGIITEYSLHYNSSKYENNYFRTNQSSYLLTALVPGTQYQFDIEAVNSKGNGPRKYIFGFTMKGNGTNQTHCNKQDLKISTISNDVIRLSWYNNGTNKTSFVYDEINNGKLISSTNASTYNVSGLQPNKKYAFRVCYENSSSFWECSCGSINITSKDLNGTCLNQSLIVSPISHTTLLLRWNRKEINKTFLIYNVFNTALKMIRETSNSSLSISGLQPNTTYAYRVCFEKRDDIWECFCGSNTTLVQRNGTNQTRCDRQDLKISTISSDVIRLTWYNNGTNKTSFVYDEINNGKLIDSTNASTYNVSGLQPNKKYSFRVCYENSSGFWECTCGSINITSKDQNGTCLNQSLIVSPISHSALVLQWNSKEINKTFLVYNIFNTTLNMIRETSNSSLSISGLQPNTTYAYRVCYEKRDDILECFCGSNTTLLKPKTQQCVSDNNTLEVLAFSTSSIQLKWSSFRLDKNETSFIYVNGTRLNRTTKQKYIVDGLARNTFYIFRVCFKEELCYCANGTTLEHDVVDTITNIEFYNITSKSFGMKWNISNLPNFDIKYNITAIEINTPNLEVKYFTTSNSSIMIGDLQEYVQYNISIQAFQEGFGGGKISTKEMQTLADLPTGTPQNVSWVPSSKSLNIRWLELSYYERNGIISDYWIYYFLSDNKNDSVLIITNSTYYNVDNLRPFSDYSIELYASNQVGDGPKYHINVSTLQDFPEKPQHLSFINISSSSVYVSWNSPDLINGILLGYNVKLCNARNCVYENVTDQEYYSNDSLLPFTTYNIFVSTINSYGIGASANLTFRTNETVPTPPSNITTTSSHNSVTISWSRPTKENGILLGYKITLCVNTTATPYECKSYILSSGNTTKMITGLKPFTRYVFALSAYNKAGSSEKEYRYINTSEHRPGPVERLEISGFDSTSVNLSWIQPNETNGIVRYKVFKKKAADESFGGFEETDDLFFQVTNLEEFVDYEFKVIAFTKSGGDGESRIISQKTSPALPAGAPQNFLATPLTSTSIKLSWEPVLQSLQNGIIQKYIIEYSNTQINVSNEKTRHVLEELEKYTEYFFKIFAVNQVGKNDDVFANATIRTLEDKPDPVEEFNCIPQSSDKILLTWKPPIKRNGILIGYEIMKIPESETEIPPQEKDVTSYLDTKLSPFTLYNYSIKAETKIGFGDSFYVSCRTNETVPEAPDELKVESFGAFWIYIKWNEPKEKLGGIIDYQVSVNNASHEIFSRSTTEKHFNISENIFAFTKYNIKVKARTKIGYGKPAEVNQTTEESIPSAIERISATATSNSIAVTWSKPHFPNGVLRYKVSKKSVDGNAEVIQNRWAATEYTFHGLNEYTNYTFIVIPFTGKGNGPEKTITKRTDSAKPTGTVQSFGVKAKSSTEIEVKWSTLKKDDQNGVIFYYTIKYVVGEGGIAKTAKVYKNSSNDKNYVKLLKDLFKYTNYSVTISATNDKGEGPTTKPIFERTHPDAPSKPILEGYKNISDNQIKIFWKEPEMKNGELNGYQLECTGVLDATSVEISGHILKYARSYETKHLKPYTQYKCVLRATVLNEINGTNFNGQWATQYITTNVSNPTDAPNFIPCRQCKNASSITLTWKELKEPNGPIQFYEIQVHEKNEKNEKTFWDSLLKTDQLTYTVTRLEPYKKYGFQCRAVGLYGLAGPLTGEIYWVQTSSSNPPPPPTALPVSSAPPSFKEITIQLWVASEKNGPVKYYYIGVIETTTKPGRKPDSYTDSELVTYNEYQLMNEKEKQSTAYIAAILTHKELLSSSKTFKIGDGSTSGQASIYRNRKSRSVNSKTSFYNGPLDAEKKYFVFQRAYTENGLYTSDKDWQGPFETVAKPVEKGGSSGGEIAGGVIAALVVIGIIIAALYIYRKIRIPSSNSSGKSSRSSSGIDNTTFINDDHHGHIPASSPVRVEDFPNYVRNLSKDGKYLFSEEFKLIQTGRSAVNATYEHSNHPINRENNRYNNIVAYDHTRVLLQPIAGVPESDYINANYIDGFNRQAAYIATQGPLENTCEAFWRMCWEQSVNTIVMLTRLEENGRIKCYQYWPEVGSMCYGVMQVTLTESHYFPSYIKRTFSLIHAEYPGSERFISQFALLTWNDHSTANSQECLTFIRRVNQGTPSSGGPIAVHCSAGVGRTGTYITLDVNLKRIEREGKIEIYNYLQHIRSQRNYMVQTEAQYVFIHDTLLEYLTFGVTEVQVRNLRDYVKKLQQPTEPGSAELNVDKEFHKLNLFDQSSSKTMHAANASCNKNKNRFLNVLPYDDSRVALRQIPGLQGSDYINANYIHGYSHAKQFIATQAPLPQTIPSFWRMVWENQCTAIVCLAQETEGGKVKIHRYWPSIEASIHGPLMVELSREETCGDYVLRELKVTHTTEGHSRTIKLFQYVSWPDNSYPESAAGLVDLIGRVQKWYQQNNIGQIVVHCSAGVGRTGVFIALCNMIERVRVEGVVDVFQTVRELRQQRPAMVQTKAQYLFCYLALQDFLASFDIYQNFF